MSPDDLLTSTQVAAILDRSARTVLRMAEQGALPVARRLPGITGALLFRRADVETFRALLDADPSQHPPKAGAA